MHDEFRVAIATPNPHGVIGALKALERRRDEHGELPRAAVTHEGEHVFIYCDSLSDAQRTRAVVQEALTSGGLHGEIGLDRWHPLEEHWEDAADPLPSDAATRAAEHERLEREETEASERHHLPEWEVRVTLPTHQDARAFAERLDEEGIPVNRRWRHLLVGANDEDDAARLAERLRAEAPAGSEIHSEVNGRAFWELLHPYSVLGGIAN